MIMFENLEVHGWEAALRGMRNPMNSWDRSDSYVANDIAWIGINDLDLATRLVKAGPEHSKFRRMITVTVDITAPLYWWKEFDTYKIGTVANSCSTMHKLTAKEFEMEDFSVEQLTNDSRDFFYKIIGSLNANRELYLETKDKQYWWNMIQILPTSYNQKRTVQMNYEVVSNICNQRYDHKLDEWKDFVDYMIKFLPYSMLFTERMNIVD